MRNRRPTLHDAISTAASATPAADLFDGGDATPETVETGRRGILVRVSPELRRRLKFAALNRHTTVQTLLLKAITEVLKAPDRPMKKR